ncbi:UbiA family prenyltransferase [bacterium]|nr:UbiA family prenyltransferase [bacterium]
MKTSVLKFFGGLIDLTRMLFFGPFVAAGTAVGALLGAMSVGVFHWCIFVKSIVACLLGFGAGFVLNDLVDRKRDEVIYTLENQDPEYINILRRERIFTKTRPLAAGIVSPAAGLIWALLLIAGSAAIIWTFPTPQRWWLLVLLFFGCIGEVVYCKLKAIQNIIPFATIQAAFTLASISLAGYIANARFDMGAVLIYLWLFFWESGHNQLYDVADKLNDLRRGINVLSTKYGIRAVAVWTLIIGIGCSIIIIANGFYHRLSYPYFIGACIAIILYLAGPLLLLRKGTSKSGKIAQNMALVHVVVLLLGVVFEALKRF